ncbi:MAG: hypothetical protein NVSMB39_6180 [Candidatus Saccharimonadales bacterium]
MSTVELGRNWRNRWCEIDIVARRGAQIHFVEVKYRRNVSYGYASEYISRLGLVSGAPLLWRLPDRCSHRRRRSNAINYFENVITA